MMNLSLGTIEVYGLPAALEAADVACKTADVKLIGYEATDGLGMVAVKIEGNVSAVQSAIAAARAAAGRITTVFATSVIARPNPQIEPVVDTDVTVGRGAATSATPLESKPRPRRKAAVPAPAPAEAEPTATVAEPTVDAVPAETEPIAPESPEAQTAADQDAGEPAQTAAPARPARTGQRAKSSYAKK